MPKFARPTSYNGRQSNQNKTGSVRAANATEASAGLSDELYISPLTLASAIGSVIPPWSETVSGIGELSTNVEAAAQLATNKALVPSNMPSIMAAPGVIGGTTPAAATFTTLVSNTSVQAVGNITLVAAGSKLNRTSVASTTAAGANSIGTVTLVAGVSTIATTAVTATSIIQLFRQGVGATGAAALGFLSTSNIVVGTSFDIRAVQPANAGAVQASDVSIIAWEIIN